jgi:hypothetical protein
MVGRFVAVGIVALAGIALAALADWRREARGP